MIDILGISFPAAYLHIGTLLLTAVGILLADKAAFSWMRGKQETLSAPYMRALHYLVGIGLALMIATGAYLAWPLKEFLIQDPAFWIKMLFVATLVINSFFIGKLMRLSLTRPYASLTEGERRALYLSGGASTIGWIGAFIAALFMTTSDWLLYILRQLVDLF